MDFEEVFAVLAVMFVSLMVFGIPIVAILTKHQRQMAELFRKPAVDEAVRGDEALLHEVRALRQELEDVREQLNRQTIALDEIQSRFEGDKSTSRLQERI